MKYIRTIFLVSAVIVFAFLALYFLPVNSFAHGDTADMYEPAVHLVQGKGYTNFANHPVIGRPPAYSLILAVVLLLMPKYFLFGLFLTQLGFLWGIVFLQFKILEQHTQSVPARLGLGLMAVLYVPHYLFVQQIAPEVFMTFLVLLFSYSVLKQWSWLIQAVIFAVLLLTKGTFLFLPIVVYGVLFLRERNWYPARMVLIIYCVSLLLISPWIIRNYKVFHKVIISSIGIGNTIWPGNNLATNGYWEGKKDLVMTRVNAQYSELQADKVLTTLAVQGMRKHPQQSAILFTKKAIRYWLLPIGYESLLAKSALVAKLWLVFYWAMLGCALYGLLLTKQELYTQIMVGLIAYMWLLHIILYAIPRYHYPLIPLIQIFASIGVAALYERYAKT